MASARSITNNVSLHHDLIFQAWTCLLGDQRVIYLSGPITTGRRWIDALTTPSGQGSDVIAANSTAIMDAARQLRAQTGRLVIEPASLSVASWSQDDYLTLWTNLIERHVDEVRFMPDWVFSIGCVREYERAVRHGIRTSALDGAPITLSEGRAMLGRAALEIASDLDRIPALRGYHHAVTEVLVQLPPG